MSREPEFKRNLKGIAETIQSCETAIASVKETASAEDLDAMNANLAVLLEVQAKWKKHEEVYTFRPKFSIPLSWSQDKQARYNATMGIRDILSRLGQKEMNDGKASV